MSRLLNSIGLHCSTIGICKLFTNLSSLTREVYLLPDLLPAGDVGAALVDAEVGLADVSKK